MNFNDIVKGARNSIGKIGNIKLNSPIPENINTSGFTGKTTTYPQYFNALKEKGLPQVMHTNNPEEYQLAKAQMNGTPTPTPTPAAAMPTDMGNLVYNQPRTQRPANADYLENTVFPITRQVGIEDAVAAGQWAAEGRGEHRFGKAPYNNPYNINAIDSNPGAAFQYPTELAGIEAYADLMKRKYAEAIQNQSLYDEMLAIQNAGYAGDPRTYRRRANNGYDSYADFALATPESKYYQ